jgi:hypothetical protein
MATDAPERMATQTSFPAEDVESASQRIRPPRWECVGKYGEMTSSTECLHITKRDRRIVTSDSTDILHLQDSPFALVAERTTEFLDGMGAYVIAAMRGEWNIGLILRWVTNAQMTCDATVNPQLSGKDHLSNLNGELLCFASFLVVRCSGHEDVPVCMLNVLPGLTIVLRQSCNDENDDTETR